MTSTTIQEDSPLAHFTFPRTGKRGVPQQFPRRLYEMLGSETEQIETCPTHPKVISWSDSGNAFRIFDVTEFANTILPKYFRTKKFSSFQRNLNLYGFTKVRRGPDTDMYAHPSFLRDEPDSLLELRKINTSSRSSTKRSTPPPPPYAGGGAPAAPPAQAPSTLRPVSPSTSNSVGSAPFLAEQNHLRSYSSDVIHEPIYHHEDDSHQYQHHHGVGAGEDDDSEGASRVVISDVTKTAEPVLTSAPTNVIISSYPSLLIRHTINTSFQDQQQKASSSVIVDKYEQLSSSYTFPSSLSGPRRTVISTYSPRSPPFRNDRGKLDLLALALEKATAGM